MAWEQLEISKPHLAYAIIGGFTSLFMLCSSIIKEKLYLGEASVATAIGLIFGPHVANLFNPTTWGNVDYITEELSRIVLIVSVFVAGVELPRAYLLRHARGMFIMLLPIMIVEWLVTTAFVYALIARLSFLESLAVAACVTATDPVLASTVVSKGKFARRVPGHLRNLLLAESGCNDGMAIPFLYLAVYLLIEKPASHAGRDWVLLIILYECTFGVIFGAILGIIARKAIKYSERHGLMDRESFLVFYFVLSLFCAGIGTIIGVDDLLVSFSAGAAFAWDSWFQKKTEESHVTNVIDLLLNLSFFVYFGSIIPWSQFNSPELGLPVWRLIVLGILVLLFRRIPAVLIFKPWIPELLNWREALFAGHFGPIGVGAIYTCIVARAELESGHTVPEVDISDESHPHYYIIQVIWPIVCFLVLSSIIVHGSTIAVFMLGKRINTLALSFTQTRDSHFLWNLPRIRQGQSLPLRRSKTQAKSERSIQQSISPENRNSIHQDLLSQPEAAHVSPSSPEVHGLRHTDYENVDTSPQPPIIDIQHSNPSSDERVNSSSQEQFQIGDDIIVEDESGNVISHTKSREPEMEKEEEEPEWPSKKPKTFVGRWYRRFMDAVKRNMDDRFDGVEDEENRIGRPTDLRKMNDDVNADDYSDRENSVERRRREQVLQTLGDSDDEDSYLAPPTQSRSRRPSTVSSRYSRTSRTPTPTPSFDEAHQTSEASNTGTTAPRGNIRFVNLVPPSQYMHRRSHSGYTEK
ncbi:plasma membrane alkali metal cation/H antiporter Sod22 [Schizosaccharomyces japonicus yFS275]|uniref:Plasma membrane alkali metal cation/H antiporter Sod22 n=1 Tax=Schizosaccharomyces japonicus (strain yFS275 / FY16936) TaxID=402676 RepID=B6JY82_SCHJY|nr:plasma membrane alkali metal cation/H antiporter Sod22 [Schizosaccharomyces japonicus yFS275]EEB06500.2 plasma membrane alkali metal cation/H antiporter Sod22 [Schizosaccharomyces japonicus yFS275]